MLKVLMPTPKFLVWARAVGATELESLVPELCLVDTSAWVDFFRGREPVASAVDRVLADGGAAVYGMVELEIRQRLRRGGCFSLFSGKGKSYVQAKKWQTTPGSHFASAAIPLYRQRPSAGSAKS